MRSRALSCVVLSIAAAGACGRVTDSTAQSKSVDGTGGNSSDSGARSQRGASSGGAVDASVGSTGGTVAVGGALAAAGGAGDGGFGGSGGFEMGGGFGTGGTQGAGGSNTGGFAPSTGGAPCSSSASDCAKSLDQGILGALSGCCTSTDACGFDATPLVQYFDIAAGCQPAFAPGMASADCPSTLFNGGTEYHCCRLDGTCGVDLTLQGLGCANAGTPGGACTIAGACKMIAQVTTTTYNGRFTPHNVGAIWIEDAKGAFVKTLSVWGTLRISSAVAWEQSSNGNTVDAVTGASRTFHGPIQAAFDCIDANGRVVPDGRYNLCMTFTEDPRIPFFDSGPLVWACMPFDKKPGPFVENLGSDGYFHDVRVTMF